MKRMKTEQKRKLAGVLAIVLVIAMILSAALPLFWASADAAEVSDYAIEANVGFDGMVKFGSNAPINVNVRNNSNKNFSGTISVLVTVAANEYSDDVDYIRYSSAVEIPKGGSGRAEFSVPIMYIQRRMKVQLIEKNKVLAETEVPLKISSYENCWVGLLSDDPGSLSYIRASYYAGGRGETVDLSDAMEQNKGFSNFSAIDVFVVNDYDFAALSEEAYSGIMDRVSQGALMIVGGKSHIGSYDRLSVDRLPQTNYFTGGDNGDSYTGNSNYGNTTEFTNADYYANGDSKIYCYGNGYIVYTDFSLTDISDYTVNEKTTKLFNAAFLGMSSINSQNNYTFEDSLIGYTDRMPNLTDYTVSVIKVLIFLYIAFIPVLYVVLKKKDKRENALKIIPSAAIIVSVLIYLVSINTVYKKPIGSVINYINFSANGTDAIEKSFINIKSPSKGKIEIIPEGGKKLVKISDENYNRNYAYNAYTNSNVTAKESDVETEIIMDEGNTIIRVTDKPMWDNTYLTMEGSYQGEGGFDADLSIDEHFILQGEVKNNTGIDFSNSVAIVSRGSEILTVQKTDEIQNGNSFDISALGVNAASTQGPGRYSSHNVIYDHINRFDRKANLKEVYKLELKQDILDGVISDIEHGSMENFADIKVTVLGFSDQPLYGGETTANGKKISANETNVFRGSFNAEYTDYQQYHNQFDANFSEWTIENSENAQFSTIDNKIILNDPTEGVILQRNCYNENRFMINWQCDRAVSVYNNKTYSWEIIDATGNTYYYGSDGYLDEFGMLRIRVESLSTNSIDIPDIVFDSNDITTQNVIK